MTTFVDTSALYALLDEADTNHGSAAAWIGGVGADPAEILVTHDFVIVESAALVHRRLGSEAIRVFVDAWLPALSVFHVDEHLFEPALAAYRATLTRRTSLVDHVSFTFMRDRALSRAFAFDADFADQGFTLVA